MATGATKMSFNHYQNGKYGTIPSNPQKDMEVTQDMHLKMSKKIAQLTKVIYALNTKNDEHEAVVAGLREQHEEQMAQLLAETKAKLEKYRQRVEEDVSSRQQLSVLQEALQKQEDVKRATLDQFDAFKLAAEQREMALKTEHSEKMLNMSTEILKVKRDFEEKSALIDSLQETYESKKESAIQELEAKHKLELDKLRAEQFSHQSALEEKAALEEKYRSELDNLTQRCDLLQAEKTAVCEDYETKLSKAQAFYEKELAVLREHQSKGYEEQVQLLQEEKDKLRKDFSFQETQYKQRIEKLISDLSLREDEVEKYRLELEAVRKNMSNQDSTSALLGKQLDAAKQEVSAAKTQLKQVEGELAASRQRCQQQAEDLLKKSTDLGELEATKLQHEAVIRDLQSQINKLLDQVKWLEGTKNALESKSSSLENEQIMQLRSLEKALEDLSISKQTVVDKYEREMDSLRHESQQREGELRADKDRELFDLRHQLESEAETQRRQAEDHLNKLKADLVSSHIDEVEKLTSEKAALSQEYDQVKSELSRKLGEAQKEVERLDSIVKDKEQGLGSMSSNVTSLKDAADRLKMELDSTRAELRTTKSKASMLENEHNKLKILHESKMSEAAEELKTQLDRLSSDLDNKWTLTLRKECNKLREELTEQKEEDKRAALAQLAKLKDEEIAAEKQGWQNKLKQLLDEMSQLKMQITNEAQDHNADIAAIKKKAEEESTHLRHEMLAAAESYAKKIEQLEKMYSDKLATLREQKDQEGKKAETQLRERHLEEMKVQMAAHKATLTSVRSDMEKRHEKELEAQAEEHGKNLESLQLEMHQRHAEEMDESTRSHQMQLSAARMELERAIELSNQKEGEFNIEISDLQEELRHRESTIQHLEEDGKRLQKGINGMSHELEAKGKEILHIRSDANLKLKACEEKLRQEFDETLSNVNADHAQDKQEMLGEFSEAQELLKEKIVTLQLKLEDAEERFLNRESRPEDVEMIKKLQEAIQEREAAVKKLLDEKRYYQMELVNRETNFNKVFSSSPNVGVLNPFQAKKVKGEKSAMRFNSSPSINARLDPIPNSPIHDEKFNSTKPLPPMSKKFVK